MILILGAGPTGLSTALELVRNQRECVLVEKEDRVGGLSRTMEFGEFKSDIGPHRFYSKNRHLYDLISSLLGARWRLVDRITRFYVQGRYYHYPIRFAEALKGVSFYTAAQMITDYLREKIKKRKIENLKDFLLANFGRTLSQFNMLNYTEKIWGLRCDQISPDWAKQRIGGLSFREAILRVFKKKGGPKTLVDQFYYPQRGSGEIYEAMKKKILSGSSSILLRSYPTKITHDEHKLVEISIACEDEDMAFRPQFVVSTIPITKLIKLLDPPVPADVSKACEKLQFRSHVSLFMSLNQDTVFRDQWIYFPDQEIPFGRIMEPKNFSRSLSPNKKTSLLIEYFSWEGDKIWSMNPDDLFLLTKTWLKRLGIIKKDNVIFYRLHREKYAYPVYTLDYKKPLSIVKDYLARFENLYLAGRAGCFRYNNQDHALEMGILAARSIIDKKRYNIDRVGMAPEYLEQGSITFTSEFQ